MHELPLVDGLVTLACARALEHGARRVVGIELTIGALCDALPEWIERYFRIVAVGTMAEGARLSIASEAAVATCSSCGEVFAPPARPGRPVACPACGSRDCVLTAGLEWRLDRIEVQ